MEDVEDAQAGEVGRPPVSPGLTMADEHPARFTM